MLQTARDYLYNVACSLDNMRRVKGHGDQLFVVFTHEALEKHAEDLRRLVEDDGARVAAMESEHAKTRAKRVK